MGRLFGTDGVRGLANEKLTAELAFNMARALAYTLKNDKEKINIVIGKDTRISSDFLEASLVSGFLTAGVNVYLAGIIPTPGLAYLVNENDFDAAAMITASHNPSQDNGIKFFNNKGHKLDDNMISTLEKVIKEDIIHKNLPLADKVGRLYQDEKYINSYKEHLKSVIKGDFSGLKVVIDSANGSASYISDEIFKSFDCELINIANEPDGLNINKNCGSTHLDYLKDTVIKEKADIGIALDGDADRVLLVDENSEELDGDFILAILAKDLKSKNELKNNGMVGTIVSNLALKEMAEKDNIDLVLSDVGDRFVFEQMLEKSYILGGEQSGHIIMSDYSSTGDGILVAVKILEILKKSNKKMSDFRELLEKYPQVIANAKVSAIQKNKFMENTKIKTYIDKMNENFNSKGRVLVRASGTENLVRVMIEGKDLDLINKEAKILVDLIEKELA